MNAGSLQRIGSKPLKGFAVSSRRPPVVEIDTEATAAYIRFGAGKVARTQPFATTDNFFNVDFDRAGRIVGIEVIGLKEFSIARVLRDSPLKIDIDEESLSRARYVSADLAAKSI
jgi:uncharacterized protein YuzE